MRKREIASVMYLLVLQRLDKPLPVRRDTPACTPYLMEVFKAMSSLAFAKGLAKLISEILDLPLFDRHEQVILRLILLAEKAKEMQERLRAL